MEVGIVEVLLGIGILFSSLYYYLTSNFDYWKKRKVAGPNPDLIFGNFKEAILGRKHNISLIKELYDEFKNEPLIGVYTQSTPGLIVKDLDLIKDVLIRDFNVFADRGIRIHDKVEPFSLHIFNLEYERWKPLRTKLSPIFTSGKLRDMFYLIADCADHFQKYLEVVAANTDSINCRELMTKFTTDTIGVCAFGLHMNAIASEESEFRKFGRSQQEPSLKNITKRFLRQHFPAIYDLVGHLVQPSANDFFERCVKETIDYRKNHNVRRNDFIDLLVDLRNNSETMKSFELTDRILISQAFVFFAAGFDTSSSTMSNTMYELALNQHVQDKLREDINEEFIKCDGKLTCDGIKNMKYLDQVVKETLRKYPAGTNLFRKTLSPYTFKDINVTIPESMPISIPVWAIHRDPEIYPNPEEYDPDRFSEENIKSRHPMAYLPFGDGPHNCIGSRFAYYQVKLAIISIVQKFKIETCDKTIKEYRLIPQAFLPMPIGGIHVKLTKIQTN